MHHFASYASACHWEWGIFYCLSYSIFLFLLMNKTYMLFLWLQIHVLNLLFSYILFKNNGMVFGRFLFTYGSFFGANY
jgi:hypothetical protein